MNTNLLLAYIIVFLILFGLTLPVTYLIGRNVIAIFQLIKEIAKDEQGIIEKHQEKRLEERLNLSEEKERLGFFRFYKERIRSALKKYGFGVYTIVLLLFLLGCYLLYMQPEDILPEIKVPEWSAVIFFPMQFILFVGYFLARTEKRKWQCQLGIIIFIGVKLLWEVLIVHTFANIRLILLLMVASFLFVLHYRKWSFESNEKFRVLQEELHDANFATDKLVQQYQSLLEQRHDNKKHFNMLYYLNQEKEIEAMQEYLTQLEQEKNKE